LESRDLWEGADVRWVGSARRRRGVNLQPGAHAVVVDAGRHRLTSFAPLASVAGRSSRPTRGVGIRLDDGTVVRVARRHLEPVAPKHPLGPEPDGAVAGWWLEQLAPWGLPGISVAALVPSSFPAVVRVLHPGDSAESEGELDEVTANGLVDLLSDATATPDDVFVAVWTGWGDIPVQRFPGAAYLDTEARGHFLLRGPLNGVLTSITAGNIARPVSGLWWPADRAWFVATEIDFPWTFVAGSEALVDRLISDPRLATVRTSFNASANQTAGPDG
jgi:hypothetical protein